jgi:MFS family permease
MLIGSALCAGSPTTAFPMLLVGRALQGMSCAGLNILTKVILADRVSLKENAKNNTIFAIVGGLGYGIGPVIGGYLTEASWRWCFILNLPIAALGIVFGFFFLRPELLGPQTLPGVDDASQSHGLVTFKTRLLTIDYGGQFLFLFGMGLLVLALTWGGSYYPWPDVKVLAPLVIGCVLFSAFLIWEFLKMPGRKLAIMFPRQMAMVPMKLIWSRNAGLLIYINFITGMGM